MTRLDEVARLREMEKKATPVPWRYVPAGISNCGNEYDDCIGCDAGGLIYGPGDNPDTHLLIAMRNAAPALLNVLSMIQPGDDDVLFDIIYILDMISNDGKMTWYRKEIECLRRYRAIAAKMEGRE